MTEGAVLVLAIAVGLLTVALLVAGGAVHAYVKKYLAAESKRLQLDVHSASLAAGIVERNEIIERKDSVIAAKDAAIARLRAVALDGASDADLDDIINGVLPVPVRRDPDRRPAPAKDDVPAKPPTRGPVVGSIGDL